jgi:TolB-like protein
MGVESDKKLWSRGVDEEVDRVFELQDKKR